VKDYLARLRAAGRALPERAPRARVQIEEHLRDALPAGADEAETRSALDRLGSPRRSSPSISIAWAHGRRSGAADWSAVILLLFGAFSRWLAGSSGRVAMALHVWSAREKVIGTLLVPGGWHHGIARADPGRQRTRLRDVRLSASRHGHALHRGHFDAPRCAGDRPAGAVALTSVATAAFLARRASVASV